MNNRLEKIKSICFNGVIIILITILLISLLEIGAKIILISRVSKEKVKIEKKQNINRSNEDDQEASKYKMGKPGLVYEPYFLFKHGDVESKSFNIENGFRKTINKIDSNTALNMNIFMFGGSTMFCQSSKDQYTIPSVVSDLLNKNSDSLNFIINNYSAGGYLNDQEVILMVRLLMEGKIPDIVIFYDGVNDVINKVSRGQPHYLYRSFDRSEKYAPFFLRLINAISSRSSIVKLIRGGGEVYASDKNVLKQRIEKMMSDYTNNIEFVKKLSESFGFDYYFLWQPNILTTKKKLTDFELSILQNDQTKQIKQAYLLAQNYLLESPIIDKKFFDLTNVFDNTDETVLMDFAHVNSIGHEVVANRIYNILVNMKLSGNTTK
ncbi:MAG: SGNH/GDSL hydrolase family protein [Bacteroidales bacterium]|nr:SGNH/GDSL hydrolase family protein [Bacteroidales bacterium]